MKRTVSLLLALLLLSGCWGGAVETQGASPELRQEETQLVLALEQGGDPVLREAARLFADVAAEESGGLLRVLITEEEDAYAVFVTGEAHLCFVDAARHGELSRDFAALSAPMRYRDYQQYTMALNGDRVRRAMAEELREGIVLLAAYYRGGNLLLADRPAQALWQQDDSGDDEAAGDVLVANVMPGSGMDALFRAAGFAAVDEADAAARLFGLSYGIAAVSEFTPDELEALAPLDGNNLYLLEGVHGITPLWLAAQTEALEALSARSQAAVREACAYLHPLIDGHYRRRDSEMVSRLVEQGVSNGGSLDVLRTAASQADRRAVEGDERLSYLLGVLQRSG